MTQEQSFGARELALTIGGPALVGALLALHRTPVDGAGSTTLLPAVIIGVTVLMMPALYICASLNGFQLSTRKLVEASKTSLVRTSIVLLGLAPALLFLSVSSGTPRVIQFVAPFAIRIAIFIGARAIFPIVFAENAGLKSKAVFAAWCFVGLGIAESLYSNLFQG